MCKPHFDAICENLLFIHHKYKIYKKKALTKQLKYDRTPSARIFSAAKMNNLSTFR